MCVKRICIVQIGYHNLSNVNSKHCNSKENFFADTTKKHSSNPINASHSNINKDTNDNVFFEILGIKLSYDDILLIFLIFFLYTEGVKDDFLFIALVLLLIS